MKLGGIVDWSKPEAEINEALRPLFEDLFCSAVRVAVGVATELKIPIDDSPEGVVEDLHDLTVERATQALVQRNLDCNFIAACLQASAVKSMPCFQGLGRVGVTYVQNGRQRHLFTYIATEFICRGVKDGFFECPGLSRDNGTNSSYIGSTCERISLELQDQMRKARPSNVSEEQCMSDYENFFWQIISPAQEEDDSESDD